MNIQNKTLYQLFKYSVYALLTANVFIFFAEEWAAAQHQFSGGVHFAQLIEAYAATIDTGAWVVLLLMFELETYVLDDKQFTPPVIWTLHALRVACYTLIVYAFYGYCANLLITLGATPAEGLADLCTLVGENWSYAVDFDEYEIITADNCGVLSTAGEFRNFPGFRAVVDSQGLCDIIRLAWVDVINAAVWILIVIVLEFDVRLQERNLLRGRVFAVSAACKFALYSALLLAAVYWGVKGDFVDFWDAFLWLVAFVFIELNVVQWREESIGHHA